MAADPHRREAFSGGRWTALVQHPGEPIGDAVMA